MPISEAIILAGGLGTRLRSAVPDLPKCMAPVKGEPFLKYVIEFLVSKGVNKFIFSLGYKHEVIEEYLAATFPDLSFKVALEIEPLGTGGAIKLAMPLVEGESVLVTNGDTLFKAGVKALSDFHEQKNADCTLSLKPMKDFDRYGVVELADDQSIKSFKEKQYYEQGLINGGLYAVSKKSFLGKSLPEKFSFEKDYLEALYNQRKMFGIVQDEYFIDIGIPEDYNRAQREL